MYKKVFKIPYPHMMLGSFYNLFSRYLIERVYPFENIVIGTFNKSILYLDELKYNRERQVYGNVVPFMTFTPTLSEIIGHDDLFCKYSNLHPFQNKYFGQDFVFQNNTVVSYVMRRMFGTMEFRCFAESSMEANDIMINMLDGFRGVNRRQPLKYMRFFTMLRKEIEFVTDDGIVKVDWSTTNLASRLIKSVNTDYYVFEVNSSPSIMLNSISDMSTFYGGSGLPEYAVGGTIQFDINIPAFYTVESNIKIKDINVEHDVIGGLDPEGGTNTGDKEIIVVEDENVVVDPDNPDDNSDITKDEGEIVIVDDSHKITYCEETYPIRISGIPFHTLANRIAVSIGDIVVRRRNVKIIDEHEIEITAGPSLDGCVDVRVFAITSTKCHKEGVCFI